MSRLSEVKDTLKKRKSMEVLQMLNDKLDMGIARGLKNYLFNTENNLSIEEKLIELTKLKGILKFYDYEHDYDLFPNAENRYNWNPSCIYICLGETRLSSALLQIKDISSEMESKYGIVSSPLRTMLIITNKWNGKTFQELEADFLYKAIRYNIWFVILLVKDGELQQISFLPNDRECTNDLKYAVREHFEEELQEEEEQEAFPDLYSFGVRIKALNENNDITYYFCCYSDPPRWRCEDTNSVLLREGTMPSIPMRKFLMRFSELLELKRIENNNIYTPFETSKTDSNTINKEVHELEMQLIRDCDFDFDEEWYNAQSGKNQTIFA